MAGFEMLPRKAFNRLIGQKDERKVSLLLGPRQSGKTTILKGLFAELSKSARCLFLDIDILSNYEKVATFEGMLNTLRLNGYEDGQTGLFYLFLDEFQRHPPFVMVMKNAYDNLENVKIYASGSSSLAIKSQVQESLAGRKLVTEILPLDFEEFVWFKQDARLAEELKRVPELEGDGLGTVTGGLRQALDEFLVFGGYPEVALKKTPAEKAETLESIFDLFVKKDLVDYLRVEKSLNVKRLVEFLAVNHGMKLRYEAAAEASGLSFHEIRGFIDILKESYLISVVRPFYTNRNKELVKIPKAYFMDPGVRNYFVKNFNGLSIREDSGRLLEGFVVSELVKNGLKEPKYWQDKNRNEVDIITEKHGRPAPIEVKFKQKLRPGDFAGLSTFAASYPKAGAACLVNLGSQKRESEEGSKVRLALPYRVADTVLAALAALG